MTIYRSKRSEKRKTCSIHTQMREVVQEQKRSIVQRTKLFIIEHVLGAIIQKLDKADFNFIVLRTFQHILLELTLHSHLQINAICYDLHAPFREHHGLPRSKCNYIANLPFLQGVRQNELEDFPRTL